MSRRRTYTVSLPGEATLRLGERCLVMGILNITPDSFAETSPTLDAATAVEAGWRMQEEGADLIDVGGESTRPGAEPVAVDEELRRVVPVIERLASRLRIPISVDTHKARVATEAVAVGAAIVNDVRGLRDSAALAEAVAPTGAALVLMHSRGTPQTMADSTIYGDVVAEVIGELRASVDRAISAGVARERIILDPGLGFAKQPAHSYGVLGRLPELAQALDRPLLVGASRKSFMREALSDVPAPARDWGTAAAVTAAVLLGAHIVRVHAIREMVQVVRVAERIRSAQPAVLSGQP